MNSSAYDGWQNALPKKQRPTRMIGVDHDFLNYIGRTKERGFYPSGTTELRFEMVPRREGGRK